MMSKSNWIEILSSSAAIITALASAWTLYINIVERKEVEELQERATKQEASINNMLYSLSLYGDLFAAEGGDRKAYISATTAIKQINKNEDSFKFLKRKLYEISMKFSADDENEYLKQQLEWPSPIQIEDIGKMLKHKESLQRFYAIQKAYELRCNSHMIDIMNMALSDRDLRVVQLAIYVINKTFEDNMIFNLGPRCNLTLEDCVIHPDEAREIFNKSWAVHKEKILGRKPREYQYKNDKNSPHLQILHLFDPEKQNSTPVHSE